MKNLIMIFSFLVLTTIATAAQDTVKVYVALWDTTANQDLYWSKMYGMKTYFSKHKDWQLVSSSRSGTLIEEELVFHNAQKDIYVKAMAYTTDSIRRTIKDFITDAYRANEGELLVFAGHDGLMDFHIDIIPEKNRCDVMVFSCVSERYFSPYLEMMLSTYTLMAPEAYAIMAAIEAWADKENEGEIRKSAANAYAQYQRIPVSTAENTFLEKKILKNNH